LDAGAGVWACSPGTASVLNAIKIASSRNLRLRRRHVVLIIASDLTSRRFPLYEWPYTSDRIANDRNTTSDQVCPQVPNSVVEIETLRGEQSEFRWLQISNEPRRANLLRRLALALLICAGSVQGRLIKTSSEAVLSDARAVWIRTSLTVPAAPAGPNARGD